MKQRIISFFCILFLGIFCTSHAYSAPLAPVNLATGIGPVGMLFQVGIAKGFFNDHGVEVTLHPYKRAVACIRQGIAKDKNDGAVVSALVVAVESFTYPDLLSIVAEIGITDTMDKIVARTDRGIRSPQDLVGKKIGVPKGGAAHYFLVTFLEKWNIRAEDTTLVFMKKKELPKAILEGKIDAVCQHDPVLGKVRKALNGQTVEFEDTPAARKTPVLAMRNDFIRKHPERVHNVLLGLFDAWTFFKQYPDESERIVAQKGHFTLEEVHHFFGYDYSTQLVITQALPFKMEQAALWAMRSGLVDPHVTPPNSLDLIDYTFLESIKPESVTIIH